ncbi:MAG: hypothetical protein ACMUIU_10060 [bacterium]
MNIKEHLPYRERSLFIEYPEPAIIFSEFSLQNFSLISGSLKLIMYGNNAFLFDLQKDFFEKQTLANHILYQNHLYYMANQVKELWSEDLLGPDIIQETPKLTEEEKERFRSLGYVEEG